MAVSGFRLWVMEGWFWGALTATAEDAISVAYSAPLCTSPASALESRTARQLNRLIALPITRLRGLWSNLPRLTAMCPA